MLKGTKDAYLLILSTSTRGLYFASNEQKTHYEILTTRKASEQKFFHVDSFRNLGLLDDMLSLIRNLGWIEHIGMQCTSYDHLILEFFEFFKCELEWQVYG